MENIITIQRLLEGRNEDFDKTPKTAIKMVRHADQRVGKKNDKDGAQKILIEGKPVPAGISSLYELYQYHRDLFHKYQSEQTKGRFDGIKYMVVFLGEKGTTARFLGIYKITGRQPSSIRNEEEVLELTYMPEFGPLEEKVIIDWGKSTVSWHQYFTQKKEVIRIDEGMSKADGTPIFKNYYDVILNHKQLQQVLNDPEWESKLKAVNCIYLISDKSNGKKYIGSTYGSQRIFGRWSEYAQTGHGGNVMLEELINLDPQHHAKNFQWSILETLPSNITDTEAIDHENNWKRKLLTREFGYNKN
ncbi:MAG: GIY-YIG nuclease family protein [Duncaniella sp.]|nr:GIY-YIG nuclease family protein [Duncaniella sp.]